MITSSVQIVVQPAEGLLLDPSYMLSEQGINWLASNPSILDAIVVSSAFYNQLRESPAITALFLPESEAEASEARGRQLLKLLESDRVEKFSHSGVTLTEAELAIQLSLADENEDDGLILADEWTYLRSHSVMLSRFRKPLDAFRKAGAAIVEYGDRLRDELIAMVVTERKWKKGAPITADIIKRAGAKWVVLSAAGLAAVLTAPTAAAASAVLGISTIPGVPVVRAFDP